MAGTLGRRPPTDWKHVEKFPLMALPISEQPTGVPVVIGVNWYANFDSPVKGADGRYWVGRDSQKLGQIRGGHCVVLKSKQSDPLSWWTWFDQVNEGICVSEGTARCMSLLNRKKYQPRPLYDEAQLIDEWPGEDYDGTSVRAGLDVARTLGLVRAKVGEAHAIRRGQITRAHVATEGISANRWAADVAEVLRTLDMPLATKIGAVPFLNSWGRDYPHITWMPGETLARLMREDGEVGLVTDR